MNNKTRYQRKPLLSCPLCGHALSRVGTRTQNETELEKLADTYLSCSGCGATGKASIHIMMKPIDLSPETAQSANL